MFLGQCAFYGTARVHDLLNEKDPDVLLAVQAANRAAAEIHAANNKNLAQHIVKELGDALA